MNFSSLVLMEKDKESNLFVRELGSYEVSDGAEYITKMYYDGEKVNMFFDTNRDVEEWEYSAIFDVFSYSIFSQNSYEIEDVDDEYNPTWRLKFDFLPEHMDMKNKINDTCILVEKAVKDAFENIKDKRSSY